MDAKNVVERLGAEEAVRKMAAFQLQNLVTVTPECYHPDILGFEVRSRLCSRRGLCQTENFDQ